MTSPRPLLSLQGLSKTFGSSRVLNQFDMTIYDGEFFTLLGPSGCGKTTILNMIAGLETSDTGSILLDGQDITGIPAEQRPVNTVFQSYALFPHMTVFDNVAFGLRMAKVAKAEIPARVREALEMVKLNHLADRKPAQLSGGQQQRVAIARAVVNRPKLLLLDESLSALDYKLRQQMQIELKRLQRQLGITFIYVTHDQEEALSMSDRVVVMNNGRVQQLGSPREIYENPANLFVARFIGEINQLRGEVVSVESDHTYEVKVEGLQWQLQANHNFTPGTKVHVLLRPEDLRITYIDEDHKDQFLTGTVVERSYKGSTLDSLIRLESGIELTTSEFFNEDDPSFDYRPNQKVAVNWVPGWEVVLPVLQEDDQ
ncbi:spermidine/putrescine ABC transporter ATP-binding protein PotA [Gilvimarinus algae]|uniref:Spermidine/putrescine import ATP-binding protein PotA n=1 Tax=Gilvimarinus algae TaxID=3058037 RepID=A0ABT8TAL5_9GAMM|nr:spermidine/putrescine ABC transporter ATP-binding protein PotA [Gilvimarinus sp. SDUM040014]MDO3381152.1 spermidine/putrescine ABC transporter ATP-binding protein PotA [Gilvimarinus sp. SDUM040014]